MVFHSRYENALTRAQELAAVGQESSAFQTLHDAIISKHFQHNYSELDHIMNRYLVLGVKLRRGRMLKEGLQAFRSFTIHVNIAGFEAMMKKLVELCKNELNEAGENTAEGEELGNEVDEIDFSPESLWANALTVLSEGAKKSAASERKRIAPWLRFLWEILRVTIDLCRNNGRLELLYLQLVNDAVDFCRKYKRKAEFRRLSEILRYHLQVAVKHASTQYELDIRVEPSLSRQLSIRFSLLDLGIELELWQEAFKALEDIHGLYMHANKNPSESLLLSSEYYEKLSKMLSMTDNFLFLSAAYVKLFEALRSEDRTDLQTIADNAALSALSIPLFRKFDPSYNLTIFDEQVKKERMTIFLGTPEVPERQGLFKVISVSIIDHCSPQIRSVFPDGFGPDLPCPKVYRQHLLLNYIYVKLQNASNNPESEFVELADLSRDGIDVKQFIINLCRAGELWGYFGEDGSKFYFDKSVPRLNYSAFLELDEQGITIHNTNFRQVALKVIEPPQNDLQKAKINQILTSLDEIYASHLERIAQLEKQREEIATKAQQREIELIRARTQKQLEVEEAEKHRLIDEAKRREKEKFEREVAEIKKNEAKMREEEQKRIAEASTARQNAEKLVATIRRFDYFERACRKTEIPLLEKDYENQKKVDKEAYGERKVLIIENARKRHEHDLAFKKSIDVKHYENFMAAATARAQQKYDEKLAAAMEKLTIAKETRLHQVMEMRQAEFEKQNKLEEDRKKEMENINRPKAEAATGPGEWRRKEASAQPAAAVPEANVWRKPETSDSPPQQEVPSHPGAQSSRYIPPSMRKKVS